jgi:methanobactin biosynthesis MbnP-like protein
MRRIYTAVLAVIVVASSGCLKEEKGSVTVVFKGTYGSTPLVMSDTHDYAFGENIQFTKSDFYLSHVRLVNSRGVTNEIIEIELVDLSYTNEADAAAGYEMTINDIFADTYVRFDFAIGVDPVMNETRPEDWPSSHPLSESRYWDAWSSFIFTKTEGNLDTMGNGNADLGWLYHTGSDKLYAALSTNLQLPVEDGGITRIVFTLDYEKLFGVGDGPIDIKDNPILDSPQDTVEMIKIVENYAKAFTFAIE